MTTRKISTPMKRMINNRLKRIKKKNKFLTESDDSDIINDNNITSTPPLNKGNSDNSSDNNSNISSSEEETISTTTQSEQQEDKLIPMTRPSVMDIRTFLVEGNNYWCEDCNEMLTEDKGTKIIKEYYDCPTFKENPKKLCYDCILKYKENIKRILKKNGSCLLCHEQYNVQCKLELSKFLIFYICSDEVRTDSKGVARLSPKETGTCSIGDRTGSPFSLREKGTSPLRGDASVCASHKRTLKNFESSDSFLSSVTTSTSETQKETSSDESSQVSSIEDQIDTECNICNEMCIDSGKRNNYFYCWEKKIYICFKCCKKGVKSKRGETPMLQFKCPICNYKMNRVEKLHSKAILDLIEEELSSSESNDDSLLSDDNNSILTEETVNRFFPEKKVITTLSSSLTVPLKRNHSSQKPSVSIEVRNEPFDKQILNLINFIYTPCCNIPSSDQIDGCLTIGCRGCFKKYFCAICFEVIGERTADKDPHNHIRNKECKFYDSSSIYGDHLSTEKVNEYIKKYKVFSIIKYMLTANTTVPLNTKKRVVLSYKKEFLEKGIDSNIFENLFYKFDSYQDVEGIDIGKYYKPIIYTHFDSLSKRENWYKSFSGIGFFHFDELDKQFNKDDNNSTYYYLRRYFSLPPRGVWDSESRKDFFNKIYDKNVIEYYL